MRLGEWDLCNRPVPVAAFAKTGCYSPLHAASIGFAPLAAGEYFDARTGRPIIDCRRNPTGVCFTAHTPGFVELGHYLKYQIIQHGDDYGVYPALLGPLSGMPTNPVDYPEYYIGFMRRMADLKARAASAGVGRHAGHIGNFLYNEESNALLVCDTDSCILYSMLEAELHGPQLLRDLANDILRCLADITRFGYTESFLIGLANRRLKPIHAFLEGFFAGRAKPLAIDSHANRLHQAFISFLDGTPKLNVIYREMARGAVGLSPKIPSLIVRTTWYFTMLPFLAEILVECRALLARSDFAASFTLPSVSDADMRERARRGIAEHLRLLKEASDDFMRRARRGE